MQCRTGIKGPGRELFDGGPILNNIEHVLHVISITVVVTVNVIVIMENQYLLEK